MREAVKDSQTSFVGGLNLSVDYPELEPTDLLQAQNARLTVIGAVVPRWGTQRLHTSSLGTVTGGFAYSPTGSSTTEIFAVVASSPSHLWSASVGSSFAVSLPLTFVDRGAIGTSTSFSFVVFRDAGGTERVYFAGGGGLYKYSGGAITGPIAGVPAGISFLAVQNRRLFGITQQNNILYYSALDDGDSLGNSGAGGGSATISTFGFQDLRALLPVGDSLLLFHEHGISRFTGWSQDDISIQSGTRGVSADTGCVSPYSVVSANGYGYFFGIDGFYRVTEAGIERISAKIDGLLRDSSVIIAGAIRGVHNKRYQEIWWTIPNISTAPYVYNYALDAWTGPYTVSGTIFFNGSEPATEQPTVFFNNGPGFICRADYQKLYDEVLSDGTGGNSFQQIIQPRRFFFGSLDHEKAYRRVYTGLRSAGSNSAALGYVTGVASGSVNIANPAPSVVARNEITGRGTYLDLTYTFTTTGETTLPIVSSITAEGFDYGERF